MSLTSFISLRLPLVQHALAKQNKNCIIYGLNSIRLLSSAPATEKVTYKRDKPHLNIGTIGHVDHG
jgi:hypothetical protein